MFLTLNLKWILDHLNASFFPKIRALPEHFLLKVFGESVSGYHGEEPHREGFPSLAIEPMVAIMGASPVAKRDFYEGV